MIISKSKRTRIKIVKILFVYPEFPETFWSFKHALRFVKKQATNPPLGLITIASMVPTGWEKRLIDLNVSTIKDKDILWADYVFISAMDVQRNSVIQTIERCNTLGVKVVAGGPLFTGEYESFKGVDHFILNEAEITLPPFLADLAAGHPKPVYQTDQFADLHLTPVPQWGLLDVSKYECMAIQLSRGCPFNCDFCNVTALLGHKPRLKSKEQIIQELDSLYAMGWRRNIFFVDDNFIGNKKYLKQEILPALIEWRKDKKGCMFITESSINLADDEELMQMMVDAGFNSVFIGIETPNEESLTECHKTQNKNRNLITSIKRLQNVGLQVMGGFIVGFDSDTPSIFQKQIDFIQNSGIVTAMVGLLQAPNGTQLYDRLLKEGRIVESMSGDNTDGSTNIIPKMDINILKNGYSTILNQLYSPQMFYERVKTFLKEYNPTPNTVSLGLNEVYALFRSIYLLGIKSKDRIYYWRLFIWSLFKCPNKFSLAITFAIYGYHFRKISETAISTAQA
jgi:radical SAM superfamily enzyme YgiQ (UPF0313 family)